MQEIESFSKKFEVRWADIDANRHMRHSAYYDYAAQLRINFFSEFGFPVEKFAQLHIGPVLFKEEAVFMKELFMNEIIAVDIAMAACRKDGTKWRIRHSIFKEDGVLSARITVDGAFIDTKIRKVTPPPAELLHLVEFMPKTEDFNYIPDKNA